MKGKIIIEVIDVADVAEVARKEGWSGDGKASGLRYDCQLSASKADCVELVSGLCRALEFDEFQRLMLIRALMGEEQGVKRKQVSVYGPLHGQVVGPDIPWTPWNHDNPNKED